MTSLLLLASLAHAQSPAPVAGSVVKSKEWVVRRGKNREEEFIGDVRYESAGTRLSSDWALYRHATKDWAARGHVALRKERPDGETLEAFGDRARQDETTQVGALDPAPGGRVSFVRTPPDAPPDRGDGGRLSWEGERVAILSGRAHVWGPRLEFWADEARYTRPDRRLLLSGGRPVLHKIEGEWTTALKAERIAATEAPRRIEARGDVRGWIMFKDPKKAKELSR